jgi:hypothetical protein
MKPRRLDAGPLALGAVLAAGAALRLARLSEVCPLGDEYMQFFAALQPTARGFFDVIRGNPHHMIVDPLTTFAAARLATGPGWLRLPSVAWGLAAIAGVWTLAADARGPRRAAAAALLLAVSSMHVEWSRRADFYALCCALAVAASALLLRALAGRASWTAYGACAGAFAVSHPHAVLVAAVHGAFLALEPPGPARRRALLAWARSWLAAALCAAGALAFLGVGWLSPSRLSFWNARGPGDVLAFLARLPGQFAASSEILNAAGAWRAVSAAAGAAAAALYAASLWAALRGRSDRLGRLCHVAVVLGTAAILASDRLFHMYMAPRQFIWILPFFLLGVVDGAERALVRPERLAAALAAAALACGGAAVRATNALASFGLERERVAAVLSSGSREGDAIVFDDPLVAHGLLYHLDRASFAQAPAFREVTGARLPSGAEIVVGERAGKAAPRTWRVTGTLDDLSVYLPEGG